ncbi:hypothetical protein FRB90_000561 [Tulasnella sp. 427]|nr:hypothetical protein FRB90_000561 [Tulasnella sp. 427]
MSVQTPPPNTTASGASTFAVKPPFHSDSPGDCIIQTSDGTQFVVYRVILSLASSVWNDMFSLPQSSETFSGEHPVITVDEDPETMQALLTMLYPMEPPQITSYDLAIKLIQACDKYFISTTRLAAFLHDILRSTVALEKNPLGVYALAWRLKMVEEIKIASRYTHHLNLYDKKVVERLMTRTGNLGAVMALWDLRRRREGALDDLARLMELDDARYWCPSHMNDRTRLSIPDAIAKYLAVKRSVEKALSQPYPACRSSQEFFGTLIQYQGYSCDRCKQSAERKDREIVASAQAAIEKFPQTIDEYVVPGLSEVVELTSPHSNLKDLK